jgi:predicted metal-dependent phosphoesterase TrpH
MRIGWRVCVPSDESAKSKADLHIHSRHTARAADWVCADWTFQPATRILFKPISVFAKSGCNATITDHNTIAGCLEIAHLPGVIFGEK